MITMDVCEMFRDQEDFVCNNDRYRGRSRGLDCLHAPPSSCGLRFCYTLRWKSHRNPNAALSVMMEGWSPL